MVEIKKDVDKSKYKLVSKNSLVHEYYVAAQEFATKEYAKDVFHLRARLSTDYLSYKEFFKEYIWCVYTSGFNARVIGNLFERILEEYSKGNPNDITFHNSKGVLEIIANYRKYKAVCTTAARFRKLGWNKFKSIYITKDPLTLKNLPYIGSVTCYHLARNIGIDCIKPDLHLERIAAYYRFDSPEEMCKFLADHFGERLGVIDYCLWVYASTFGTKWMER